ncbi:type II toxin-antitoxin system CcdA family antitoxin [Pectobacterium carotovorum]
MKHRISIAVNKDDYQPLNSDGINISSQANEAIDEEIRRIKAEEWKKEN